MKLRHWIIIALLLVLAVQFTVSGQQAMPVDIQRFVDQEAGVVIWVGQAEWCDERWGCSIGLGMFGLPLYETDLADATPVIIPVPVEPTPTWAVPTGVFLTNTPTATPGEPTQEPFTFTPTPTLTTMPTATATWEPTRTATATITP